MKKGKFLMVCAMMPVLGLALVGCSTDSNNNENNNSLAIVNLQNEHGSDTIWWFELKNSGIVTVGENVEVKPYFSKQFQVPPGTYIAGVTAGSATDLRQCSVSISGGQMITLVFNGTLFQR